MEKRKNYREYAAAFLAFCLMIIQRFFPHAGYGPVMDDWFLYGDLYDNIWTQYIIPTQKLAIRPMVGLFDTFIIAPLFTHMWIVKLLMCCMLFAAVLMLYKVLEKNGFAAGGALLLAACLLPLNTEATYWIGAASRIVCALFFISLSLMLISHYIETSRTGFLVLYIISGLFAVGFYEQAILPYLFLSAYIILKNGDKKLLAIPIIHAVLIALFYLAHHSSPEIASRGQLLTENILQHTKSTGVAAAQILVPINMRMLSVGFKEGTELLLSRYKIVLMIIAIISVIFGYFSSANQSKKDKFEWKKALIGILFAASGIVLVFVLSDTRFTIRYVFFFIVGLGVFAGEILRLVPRPIKKIVYIIGFSSAAFVFTVSGIGIVNQFNTVSAHDTEIADNLIEADTEKNLTDLGKCSYLLDTYDYYSDVNSVNCWETVRAACSGYADITGCVKHRLGIAEINNIMPIKEGEPADLATNLWANSCSFFALMPDLSVISLDIEPDGDNFILSKDNGDLYGKIIFDEGSYYHFEK